MGNIDFAWRAHGQQRCRIGRLVVPYRSPQVGERYAMSLIDRLKDLPDWPARMTAPIAAAYMGVSESAFIVRFGSIGVKEGRNRYWARMQLDRYIAAQFDIPLTVVSHIAEPLSAFDVWLAEDRLRSDGLSTSERKKRHR